MQSHPEQQPHKQTAAAAVWGSHRGPRCDVCRQLLIACCSIHLVDVQAVVDSCPMLWMYMQSTKGKHILSKLYATWQGPWIIVAVECPGPKLHDASTSIASINSSTKSACKIAWDI
jgi:hypothetical protein